MCSDLLYANNAPIVCPQLPTAFISPVSNVVNSNQLLQSSSHKSGNNSRHAKLKLARGTGRLRDVLASSTRGGNGAVGGVGTVGTVGTVAVRTVGTVARPRAASRMGNGTVTTVTAGASGVHGDEGAN
jgi:hypothetical protein